MAVIEHFWYRTRPAHLLLIPLSLLFRAVVAARRALYARGTLRSERLPVPVVVVGNLSVGGTGKTPLVIWLVTVLRTAGYRPGIITRGYGGARGLREVTPATPPAEAGDEALLLARRTGAPVFAGPLRAQAGRALLSAHPECDVLVSDDGLQHYALARDVEIAVIDGQRGFGNGRLLPAGPLREPIGRLREVDAIVLNGTPAASVPAGYQMQLKGERIVNLRQPQLTAQVTSLQGRVVHAIAGIGNPRRFFEHLRALGLTPRTHPFPDHFAFTADDLAFAGTDAVLMTEKDAVKCLAFALDSYWYLPVEAEVDPALSRLILAKLETVHGRQAPRHPGLPGHQG